MVLLVLKQVTDKQDVKWIYFLHIKPAILRQRVRDSDHMVEHIYFLQGLLRLVPEFISREKKTYRRIWGNFWEAGSHPRFQICRLSNF